MFAAKNIYVDEINKRLFYDTTTPANAKLNIILAVKYTKTNFMKHCINVYENFNGERTTFGVEQISIAFKLSFSRNFLLHFLWCVVLPPLKNKMLFAFSNTFSLLFSFRIFNEQNYLFSMIQLHSRHIRCYSFLAQSCSVISAR